MATCEWCGFLHGKRCPQVKAMNFHRPVQDETGKFHVLLSRVEFIDSPLLGIIGDPEVRIRAALRKIDEAGYLSEERVVQSSEPTAAMMGAGIGAFTREISELATGADFVRLRDNAHLIVMAIHEAMSTADAPAEEEAGT